MTHFNSSTKTHCFFALILALPLILVPHVALSTFISPARLVIDANKSSAEMTISNKNKETQVYTFEWQDRAVRADGKTVTDEEARAVPGYKSAAEHLAYSPRKVVIAPGESQRVRIFVKRNQLTEGEYRSHIQISGKSIKEREHEQIQQALGGSIGVIPKAGIPVMVRHGKTRVEIEPIDFSLAKGENGRPLLNVHFKNNSTRTIYAIPKVYCHKPDQAEPDLLKVRSIRVYYEAKIIKKELSIGSVDTNLDACQSVTLDMVAKGDFEYRKTPFYSQVLK